MSRRLSILSVVLLVVAGASAAWLVRSRPTGSSGPLDSGEIATRVAAPVDELKLVATGDSDAEPIEPNADRDLRQAAVRTEPGIELAEPLWVEGRVVFPDGTPLGEPIEVVAEAVEPAVRGDQRAIVGPDGSFRVGFPQMTETGSLDLRSSFLYLEREVELDLSKLPDALVLQPKLGGCVRGRLVLARESPEAQWSFSQGRIRISTSSWNSRREAGFLASTKLSPTMEFELPGIPPGDDYIVSLRSRGEWCSTPLEEVCVIAGEITRADLEAFPGVRIAGRVLDDRGAPIARAKVELWRSHPRVDEPRDARSRETHPADRTVRSASDGRFVLTGVPPGEWSLMASSSGYTAAHHEIGAVGPGTTLEDVTIRLAADVPISGIVRWPDGSLAVKCRLFYECQGEVPVAVPKWKRQGSLSLKHGRFDLPVALSGPWKLTARAFRTPDPVDGQAQPWETWVAHAEDLIAGSTGVVLTLAPSLSIRGRVFDESGAPLDTIPRVLASPASSSVPEESYQLHETEKLCRQDGTFELGGLHEGAWRISVLASGYVHASATVVEVMGNGAPVEIALARTATISGRVVDPGGQPVAGARIFRIPKGKDTKSVVRHSDPRIRSDDAGRFVIRNVEPGACSILADSPGGRTSLLKELNLSPGQHLQDLELRITPPRGPAGR
ncbi:MAG: carboxypeptidase-like regulatory domain-containing protein [Planctomycetota bacterium]